jgi:hypothetical protein
VWDDEENIRYSKVKRACVFRQQCFDMTGIAILSVAIDAS